jgi:structural maintenance of chromosome 2
VLLCNLCLALRSSAKVISRLILSLDAESAKNVTFHPDIKLKSITLDGDVYDPSGSLSGGSRSNGTGLLVRMGQLKVFKVQLFHETEILNKIIQKLTACQKDIERFNLAKQDYDLKVHQVTLLGQQLDSNTNSKVINQVVELKQQMLEQEALIQTASVEHKEACKRQEELEVEIDQLTYNREGKLISLQVSRSVVFTCVQKNLDSWKASLKKDSPVFKASQQEVDLLLEEISIYVFINYLRAWRCRIEQDRGTNQGNRY